MKAITKQTYLVFWQHVRRYRLLFWFIVLSIAAGAALSVVVPLYYKDFFNLLAGGQGPAVIVPQLLKLIGIILLFNMGIWLVYRLGTFGNNYFQPRVMADIQDTCFDYLHQHSFGFFINRFVGALVRKVGRLTRALEEVTDAIYWNLLPMGVRLLLVLAVVFVYYPTIGAILFVWLVTYLSLNYALTLKKLKLDEAAAAADTRVTAYLADTITNQSNLKVFTALPEERLGFGQVTQEQFSLTKRSWDFDATVEAVQAGLMFMLEFLVFYIGVSLWQRGQVTVGDFVLVQTYLIQVFDQLWGFGRVVRRMYRSLADAEEMVEILNTPHQVQDLPEARPLQVTAGEVVFQDVRFTYTNSREVISNFNLVAAPGEKVGIVGPSGAGKSTLVALIFRFFDVTSGGIFIDGQNISQVTQDSLRQNIGLVPQDPVLFHRTLLENIRYGRRQASEQEVRQAAHLAHCDEFIDRLPEGYETYVGERGIKLSGGERQRVAIARAILKNAPILVLDEATSSLDSQTESLIQDALSNLMVNKTTIVIAHRLSTIMKLDRIIVVHAGMVHEVGSHRQLLKHGGLYKKLWELQVGGFIS
ncbi:MAG: ABC transporter ATP-binding protein [Candidatus Kerfeldbacteria bacterium]|nr:ABC transporter ATP-binding protein [Candidatus Kerfeldbacteria bacterium]